MVFSNTWEIQLLVFFLGGIVSKIAMNLLAYFQLLKKVRKFEVRPVLLIPGRLRHFN